MAGDLAQLGERRRRIMPPSPSGLRLRGARRKCGSPAVADQVLGERDHAIDVELVDLGVIEVELVAELGAAFLCGEAGIDPDVASSAAYLDHWRQKLRRDPRLIVTAAQQAQKAADHVSDSERRQELVDRDPSVSNEPSQQPPFQLAMIRDRQRLTPAGGVSQPKVATSLAHHFVTERGEGDSRGSARDRRKACHLCAYGDLSDELSRGVRNRLAAGQHVLNGQRDRFAGVSESLFDGLTLAVAAWKGWHDGDITPVCVRFQDHVVAARRDFAHEATILLLPVEVECDRGRRSLGATIAADSDRPPPISLETAERLYRALGTGRAAHLERSCCGPTS